jgi:hypothetical protein
MTDLGAEQMTVFVHLEHDRLPVVFYGRSRRLFATE